MTKISTAQNKPIKVQLKKVNLITGAAVAFLINNPFAMVHTKIQAKPLLNLMLSKAKMFFYVIVKKQMTNRFVMGLTQNRQS
jgi:hypothetical protein